MSYTHSEKGESYTQSLRSSNPSVTMSSFTTTATTASTTTEDPLLSSATAARREGEERLAARVTELEDLLQGKASRIAELEAELFTERMKSEERLRDLSRRHDEELERVKSGKDGEIEEVRHEFERRAEEERRISHSLEEETERKVARIEEERDRRVRALEEDISKLKRDLDEASSRRRELEVELREVSLRGEEALRAAGSQKSRVEEEYRREIGSLRSVVSKAEESVMVERRAKEKAIDEKISLTRELTSAQATIAELRSQITKLQQQLK